MTKNNQKGMKQVADIKCRNVHVVDTNNLFQSLFAVPT